MRRDYEHTKDGEQFKKGQLVKCIYNYDKAYTDPKLGKVYVVTNCYWYHDTEFVDIKRDGEYLGGGWYASSFELYQEPFVYRSKKESPPKPRFTNHRRIILGDT